MILLMTKISYKKVMMKRVKNDRTKKDRNPWRTSVNSLSFVPSGGNQILIRNFHAVTKDG